MKLPNLPQGWLWKSVGELGIDGRPAVKAGPFGSELKKSFYVQSGFRVYGQEQVLAEDLSFGDYYIDEKRFKRLQSCEVKAGDILVSLVGSFGKALIIPETFEPGIINPRLVRLSLDPSRVDPRFFYRFFQSPLSQVQIRMQSHGGTMDIVNAKNISNIFVPLPPLTDQRRLAAILDKANSLREKRRHAIAKLDALLKSTFVEMFGDPVTNPKGWRKAPMGSLMTIRRGGSPRPIEKYLGGNINWIKIGDATSGNEIYLESCKDKIISEGLKKTVSLKPGSLIFANCGVSLGFARILKIDGCIHDGWLSFENIPEDNIDKIFLLKALNGITEYFRGMAPAGTQPNLNTGIMKNFEIILPPLSLQKKFNAFIEKSEMIRGRLSVSEKKIEALFQSLQQRAFSGELFSEMALVAPSITEVVQHV